MLRCSQGRFDEALARVRRARELDPMSPLLPAVAAGVDYFAGRYDQALEQLELADELAPGWGIIRALRGMCFEEQGRLDEAIEELEAAAEALGVDRRAVVELAYTYAMAGRSREALEVVDFHEQNADLRSSVSLAHAFFFLGQGHYEQALEWLSKAAKERNAWMYHVLVDPRFDPLRGRAGYDRLVRQMGVGSFRSTRQGR
jgi:tetratricopeptide (TPR) repeat protein